MDKQAQATDETASYKEYPPSEIYTTSDPPPAYMKPRQTSIVQVARIAAYTLVAVSFILGSFILASSYVTATLSCQEYQPYPQEYIEDRLPRFQGLVADPLESEETKHHQLESADHHKDEETNKDQQAEQTQSKDEQVADHSKEEKEQQTDESEQQDEHEFKFKLPIHLDLDALTGALMEGNSKSKMNCVVEKQKSEEVLNKDQRELITFGLDLAALDPGLKHVTGERLAIVCETSREAPKESQPNQIVLPFPLPGFHAMPQRMMPHHMPQQMPQMMHHQMPQNGLPRMPYHMQFFRPNPFQNIMARQQIPQSIPRRGVEEIPILVLEDESRLQNLVELPRVGHPQVQNLVDLHRVNPQISQIQNIVDLARAAAPSLQNLIEIPEHKPFHMIHPAVPEARNLPPWARPEVQDQVVQIQAMPAVMRPPQPPRPQVQIESRPFHIESAAIQVEGRPIQVEGRPLHMEPRPVQMEHRPIQMEHRPVQMEHRPVQMEHRPIQMEHRPIRMEEHRPIQLESRPMQMEVRPDSRHPEGRSLPMEGRVLPVPSDTVNPPPLPFEMQEPSRPHFVQPRSVRSVENQFHPRDKRDRR